MMGAMKLPALCRSLLTLAAALGVAGCNYVPVTPWVAFTAYSNPNFDHTDFETQLNLWKQGHPVVWTVHFSSSEFVDQQLVIASNGLCSLGPPLPTTGKTTRTFRPTQSELSGLVDTLIGSGIFSLYDGHYGAYLQAGGTGGPDMTITVNDLIKHVSKDDNLNASVSHEASIIEKASNAVADLALKYLQ